MHTFIAIVGLLGFVAAGSQDDTAAKAFEHYEAIRVALAGDTMTDVKRHAAALVPLAEKIGGKDASQAAEQVGAAADIKTARERFGPLSAALIPAFEKAALPNVHVFTCSMVGQSWAQKGKEIQNPYYGKSMLACGVPKK